MADIFLSYCEKDEERLKPIFNNFKEIGWTIWTYVGNLAPGIDIQKTIEKQIELSKCVIVFWSNNSIESRFVKDEADRAIKQNKYLPVLIDDLVLPIGFGYIQAIQLKNWDYKQHNEYISLLNKVAEKLHSYFNILPSSNKSEWVQTYQSESLIEGWDELQQNSKEMDLMGHTMYKLFYEEKIRNNLKIALAKGCIIRLLLLDPKSYKAIEVGELLDGKQLKLQTKIEDTLDQALQLQNWAKQDSVKGRIDIRIIREVRCKINRYDDHLYHTDYFTIEEPGINSTCKHVKKGMATFNSYLNEFNRNWNIGLEYREYGPLPCLPAEDSILKDYDNWKRLKHTLQEGAPSTQEVPLPKMAVIYPTYKCTLRCDYCSTGFRKLETGMSMSANAFTQILDKILKVNIFNIELSGGGEPLEHDDVKKIIEELSKRKESDPKLNFGILTNGLHINDYISEALVKYFSYVRLSFNEKIASDNSLRAHFLEILQKISNKKNTSNNIGIKLLLTENLVKKEKDANFVSEMIKDISKHPFNHLRIKSVRGDKKFQDQLSEVWPKILDTAFDMLYSDITINADIRQNNVGRSFKCWFGAAIMVVDPYCFVHPCLNYHNSKSRVNVGNLLQDDLKKIWISGNIKPYLEANSFYTCNHENSVDCRIAKYQHLLEERMATERNRGINLRRGVNIPGL